MHTVSEAEWEKMQQAHVLANVQHAFDYSVDGTAFHAHGGMGLADALAGGYGYDEGGGVGGNSGPLHSPSGQNDAQNLAVMLQEQLDAINHEIRMIQEEKQNAELRTEELESQVGSADFHFIGRKSPELMVNHVSSFPLLDQYSECAHFFAFHHRTTWTTPSTMAPPRLPVISVLLKCWRKWRYEISVNT